MHEDASTRKVTELKYAFEIVKWYLYDTYINDNCITPFIALLENENIVIIPILPAQNVVVLFTAPTYYIIGQPK